MALFIFSVVKNFVVYRSSAGSGKTFTLVRQYLRLALQEPKRIDVAYRRILAITFTNKAAAEMKSRVISALSSICNEKELPDIGKMLLSDLAISEIELRERTGILLESILHNYSDFSIGTIDAFTHRLVRTFAFDLKLPAGFNVELNTSEFYRKVIARLLNSLGEDTSLSLLLKDYAIGKTEENAAWDPEESLLEFSNMLLSENAETYLQKLRAFTDEEMEEARKTLIQECKNFKNHVQAEGQKALSLVKQFHLSDSDLIGKSKSPISLFSKCAEFNIAAINLKSPVLNKAITENKWVNSIPNASEINNQLTQAAKALYDFLDANYEAYLLNKTISNNIYPLMLLRRIENITNELKEEERVVFISEFNERIHELIKNEPTPFIYERLGERYRNYLIDEFQDTSTMQWQNILPLIENALSSGHFNLIVGDGKQSIYRWRNANVNQFASLPETDLSHPDALLRERTEVLKRHFNEEPLNNNYRSTKDIIEFNNAFFDMLKNEHSYDVQTIYRAHQQGVINSTRGYITLNCESIEKSEVVQRQCEHTLQHIHNALTSGFNYRDIAIIVRKNYQGNQIADYLMNNDIPVVSSDSLLLKNSSEVNVLINYLKCIEFEQHQIPAAAILNYLFHRGCMSQEELHENLREIANGKSIFGLLKKLELLPEAEGLNLLDQVASLCEELNFPENAATYVRFFLDAINEFMVVEGGSPGYFLEWWENKKEKASLIIPDNANAVRIMTIHASKGLEFPVVICPFFNWEFFRPDYAWVDLESNKGPLPASIVKLSSGATQAGFEKDFSREQSNQILDNINLLYVAFTRAANRLHIITCKSIHNNKKSIGDWIQAYFFNNAKQEKADFYTLGELQPNAGKTHKQIRSTFILPGFSATRIRQGIAVKNSKFESDDTARQEGIVLHWLLSHLHLEDNIEALMLKSVRKGLVKQQEVPGIAEKIQKIHGQLTLLQKEAIEIVYEAELITNTGEILRPDLVIIKNEEAHLVDYKTGKKEKQHALQIQAYMQALKTMNYPSVKGTLLYLEPLEQVDFQSI